MIITFNKQIDDAVNDYKKKVKYNFLVPSFFKIKIQYLKFKNTMFILKK